MLVPTAYPRCMPLEKKAMMRNIRGVAISWRYRLIPFCCESGCMQAVT